MSSAIVIVGMDRWVADMELAEPRLLVNSTKAVAVTSRKIQTAARARIRGHKYLPQYPASITYDVRGGLVSIEGEIGPDKDRPQGALGNILEFGTAKNAPIEHLGPALAENEEDLVRGIELAVHQALL